MFIKNQYIIKQDFMYMVGCLDRHGYLCTLVMETKRKFIVSKSPLDILSDSIRSIGFNLDGAMKTSRELLQQEKMCPIIVNPVLQIVVFPTRSHLHQHNIWFNPHHVKRTTSINRHTMILFSNDSILVIPTRLASFNHKVQKADQLLKLTSHATEESFALMLDRRKKRGSSKDRIK